MSWFKQHADTITIIFTVLGAFFVQSNRIDSLSEQVNVIEKDVAIIKTVLILKNIYPEQLADKGKGELTK